MAMVKIYCPPFRSCFLHYVWWFPAASAMHSGVHIFVPDFCYFEVCGTTYCFPSALQVCLNYFGMSENHTLGPD